jgi:predicted nucleic acid-binding protein
VVLVDTSVWVEHFREGVVSMTSLLHQEEVLSHPFVIGELACGHLTDRRDILETLQKLPQSTIATHEEVLHFIESKKFMGRGLGFIDVHLLACSLLTGAFLWTKDRALCRVATELNVSYSPS